MKTFEKWLYKSKYEFIVRYRSSSTEYCINGDEGVCKVVFNKYKSRGCAVIDDNGFTTEVPSVKKAIELVDFLSGGIC